MKNLKRKTKKPFDLLIKYHKWLALILSIFLLLFAFSGIVLNHRSFFSVVDVNRNWLPGEFRFNNWNLAAVKSGLKISADSVLIYGNIGVWLTDKDFTGFNDFNKGFPNGSDNRKIFSMLKSKEKRIYAGTQSGLYILDNKQNKWKNIHLPEESRITGLTQKTDTIFVLTRSYLYAGRDSDYPEFKQITLPPPENFSPSETLFRTLWLIHSGKIFGKAGRLFADLMAAVLIFLIFSGLIYFFTPGILKRISSVGAKSKIKRINRSFINWHNTIGYITVFFLLIITITGMFLRPPLLIPIAGTRVPVIKFTWLDNPNPWFDKLRDIIWDDEMNIFLFSTSEGTFYSGPALSAHLKAFDPQPPVSVMGVNVFEKYAKGGYLVGSFSGIYRWVPEMNLIIDHISNIPLINLPRQASPFGNIPVTGRIELDGKEILFDYINGAFCRHGENVFVPMPGNILESSPFSLWNLALEIHTGRIFYPLVGNFYVLYIPLVGITTLVILITGFILWWTKWRKRKSKK